MSSFADWFYNKMFGYPLPKQEMRGIVGVTQDGCYLLQQPDGTVVKSHPIQPIAMRSEPNREGAMTTERVEISITADGTCSFEIDLTPEELAGVKKLAERCERERGEDYLKPSIEIYPVRTTAQ